MPKVIFRPSGHGVQVPPGTDLLEAARQAGVELEAACGGEGTCGKCAVRVVSGQVDFTSSGALCDAPLLEGCVLACVARVTGEDLTIEVPEPAQLGRGQFAPENELHLVRPELLPSPSEFDPHTTKRLLQVAPPQPEDGLSDLDRLTRALKQECGKEPVVDSLFCLRKLAEVLRADNGRITATLARAQDEYRVIDVQPGDTTLRHFALAIDVGTTTVAVQLIDLAAAQVIAAQSDYNDQMPCGLDVISRINYARHQPRLEELRRRVLRTINRLIRAVAASGAVDPSEIASASLSGNTVMTHLLLGLKPEYLRLDPYTPTVLHLPSLRSHEAGLEINPEAKLQFSPCLGSYVGGDITAGILCTDLARDAEEINLFIDIGTNGEIVVGNRHFLMACACSAGPAFEGGGIECGVRAATGAIDKVQVDPATGAATYSVIGDTLPRGICGSGMIDLLAQLFLAGWIDAAGKFDRGRSCPAICHEGRRASYVLAPAAATASGRALVVTEIDLENILRTKASIYSASALLLRHLGLSLDSIGRIYIAGGFGRFLDLENAITIGLLPDRPREVFQYLGNASLMGSYMTAVSREFRRRQLALARRVTYVELNTAPAYMEQYTGALFLPHTDLALFPSVQTRLAATRVAGKQSSL
jgi:uncharacterized 2Fe-2S/4Fe-4S cluster protein (DUF4445 family)